MSFVAQHSLAHFWRRSISKLKQGICILRPWNRGIIAKHGYHGKSLFKWQRLVQVLDQDVSRYSALQNDGLRSRIPCIYLFMRLREWSQANTWSWELVAVLAN
jgi:hypothetical protein